MEDNKMIPFVAHESMMARMERANGRLWILSLVLVFCLIASNLAWFFYDQQFETYEETTTTDVTQDSGDGGENRLNVVGGDYYGEAISEDDTN